MLATMATFLRGELTSGRLCAREVVKDNVNREIVFGTTELDAADC
jgi:hypothetical protein